MPVLSYFNIRGRVEPSRLLLAEASVEYEAQDIPVEEWPSKKASFPHGQVPTWECTVDGQEIVVAQSQTILRHIARTHGLDGTTALAKVRADMYAERATELLRVFGEKICWTTSPESDRAQFMESLPAILDEYEGLLKSVGTDYLTGAEPTYADFICWHYLQSLTAIDENVHAKHPSIHAFIERIRARPRIAAYLKSDRRFKVYTVAMAHCQAATAY
eukprot:NODE_7335_length_774_cov_73.454685_g7093_i0.p1 GENE.NODE_7335_length_774_cov_73.454685_g7093_i0~~NODE_7335_length_774_cov_73.454685_g7093_i0.p1  ORF type:complete len:236 (+),score=48.11 NODE_7335_length_774_cov_73.454685_g7093_i0:60-710(+)